MKVREPRKFRKGGLIMDGLLLAVTVSMVAATVERINVGFDLSECKQELAQERGES